MSASARRTVTGLAAGAVACLAVATAAASYPIGEAHEPQSMCNVQKGGEVWLQTESTTSADWEAHRNDVVTSWSFRASESPPRLGIRFAERDGLFTNRFRIVAQSDVQTPVP